MNKFVYTSFLLFAALAILSSTSMVMAQSPITSPTTTTTTTAATSASGSPTTTGPAPTITAPGNGTFTSVPNFSSLATLISSYASGRSANPGNTPTNTANSAVGSMSSLLSTDSRSVFAGMGLVMFTAVVAAIGTIAL
ncbi:hypothetical protein BGZ51_002683 [Haplosporangium sp. Z 767]|nr:hypothetical protein BGZ51_002683 [Haplosporangium sp. Z 767]KAF9188815.1 hypothetical protein BGZ50_001128 [Haplosporangium sp. Z 11]